jgi:DnaJ-class molecular chaperone
MPYLRGGGAGDLLVRVDIDVPKKMTDAQKNRTKILLRCLWRRGSARLRFLETEIQKVFWLTPCLGNQLN